MNGFTLPESISKSIFRAYDIRGIVDDSLTVNDVYAIGRSLGSEARELDQNQIVMGRDSRLSSPYLSRALCAGLLESGLEVLDIGEVPTPLMYFAAYYLGVFSGVTITGSHNPKEYNGLKMLLGSKTLSSDRILKLYQRVKNRDFISGEGKYRQEDIITTYINRLKKNIQVHRPLKVVVDCGNGVTAKVAPAIFRALGCEVVELFCEIDGQFPNHHPDPSQKENLQDLIQTVEKTKADLGVAFDGDGDRLGVVTNMGEIIWPDRQLMLFAKEMLTHTKGALVLYDVKCSQYLASVIKENGGEPMMWKTGHSFIKNKMQETGALLAGEMSGHLFFKDRWYGFDDAIYAGARLLEIVSQQSHPVSEVFNSLPNSVNTPELQIPMHDDEKFDFMDKLMEEATFPGAKITTIDGLRVDFTYGWGLIRPSNTSPNLVLRFEADDDQGLQRIQEMFRTHLLALDPALNIPF